MDIKVYGKFTKKNSFVYRTNTFIQFGESEDIIGATVLCNPGNGNLEDPILQEKLDSHEGDKPYDIAGYLSFMPDYHIRELLKMIKEILGDDLDGRFMVYNLITFKHPRMHEAMNYTTNKNISTDLLFKDLKEFKEKYKYIPWILLGWGNYPHRILNAKRNEWLDFIEENDINYIGMEYSKPNHYFYPFPKIEFRKIEILNNLKKQFKKINDKNPSILKKVVFNINATKSNLIPNYKQSKFKFNDSVWILDLSGPQYKLESFSNIFIKEEYKLIGYLYSSGMGGNGYVYAIPKEDVAPAPRECEIQQELFLTPPKPINSLPSFMMSIDGDRSPLSYLQAAILYHELCEYGASWHGVSWGRDIMLPVYRDLDQDYSWDMLIEEPEIMNPNFYYDEDNTPTVVFYTINDIGTVTLIEYKHIFDQNDYNLKIIRKIIAEAGPGIIF